MDAHPWFCKIQKSTTWGFKSKCTILISKKHLLTDQKRWWKGIEKSSPLEHCVIRSEKMFSSSQVFFLHYIIEITEWKFGFISSTLAKFWLKLIEFKTRATCFKCWCGKQLENQCTTLINVAHFTSSFKPYQVDLSRKNTSTVYQQIKSVHLSSFSFEKPKKRTGRDLIWVLK